MTRIFAIIIALMAHSLVYAGQDHVYRIAYSPGALIHISARERVKAAYERAGFFVFIPCLPFSIHRVTQGRERPRTTSTNPEDGHERILSTMRSLPL